jgi:hypothetical protein
MEIDAFAIPVFVHSQGGLDPAADFQDGDAYDALLASFTEAGLESAKAKVVLVSHAYDRRNRAHHLRPVARHGARSGALADREKIAAAPALERSMQHGWSATAFGADDSAVELRFLLGFALKRADDPFYKCRPAKKPPTPTSPSAPRLTRNGPSNTHRWWRAASAARGADPA